MNLSQGAVHPVEDEGSPRHAGDGRRSSAARVSVSVRGGGARRHGKLVKSNHLCLSVGVTTCMPFDLLLVTSNLTFAAACASAGITVLIGNDLGSCGKNHCTEFETATAMAFLSWFAALPSFLLNFWSVASR